MKLVQFFKIIFINMIIDLEKLPGSKTFVKVYT